MMIILYIYFSCWFFTSFEPLQELINQIFQRIKLNNFTNMIWIILGCQKCLTFWLTLLLTLNPLTAFILAAIAQIHIKIIE